MSIFGITLAFTFLAFLFVILIGVSIFLFTAYRQYLSIYALIMIPLSAFALVFYCIYMIFDTNKISELPLLFANDMIFSLLILLLFIVSLLIVIIIQYRENLCKNNRIDKLKYDIEELIYENQILSSSLSNARNSMFASQFDLDDRNIEIKQQAEKLAKAEEIDKINSKFYAALSSNKKLGTPSRSIRKTKRDFSKRKRRRV